MASISLTSNPSIPTRRRARLSILELKSTAVISTSLSAYQRANHVPKTESFHPFSEDQTWVRISAIISQAAWVLMNTRMKFIRFTWFAAIITV